MLPTHLTISTNSLAAPASTPEYISPAFPPMQTASAARQAPARTKEHMNTLQRRLRRLFPVCSLLGFQLIPLSSIGPPTSPRLRMSSSAHPAIPTQLRRTRRWSPPTPSHCQVWRLPRCTTSVWAPKTQPAAPRCPPIIRLRRLPRRPQSRCQPLVLYFR